jgi:hypothetical protein
LDRSHPILLVSRADGDWQFLCGMQHNPDDIPHVIGLLHILEIDPSLQAIMDLPAEWEAERADVSSLWTRLPCQG